MQLFALVLALTVPAIAAEPVADAMLPGYEAPDTSWRTVEEAERARACADRIHQVREANGLPKLDSGVANIDAPMLIAAVDKRIDGCAVLQMKGDANDVRPVPKASGEATLQPAS